MSEYKFTLFTEGLFNLNYFYALPGFWQAIVLHHFEECIHNGFVKTKQELDQIGQAEQQKMLENGANYKISTEAYFAFQFFRNFANFIIKALAGADQFTLEKQDLYLPEQIERLADIRFSDFYRYLLQIFKDTEFDEKDDIQEAWMILNHFVNNFTEEERDEIAERYRRSLPPVK